MSIKAVFGDDIRRFALAQPTIAALAEKICTLFGLQAVRITWRDADGDSVTIASDSDLQAALGSTTETLRVFVTAIEYDEPARHQFELPQPSSLEPHLSSAEHAKEEEEEEEAGGASEEEVVMVEAADVDEKTSTSTTTTTSTTTNIPVEEQAPIVPAIVAEETAPLLPVGTPVASTAPLVSPINEEEEDGSSGYVDSVVSRSVSAAAPRVAPATPLPVPAQSLFSSFDAPFVPGHASSASSGAAPARTSSAAAAAPASELQQDDFLSEILEAVIAETSAAAQSADRVASNVNDAVRRTLPRVVPALTEAGEAVQRALRSLRIAAAQTARQAAKKAAHAAADVATASAAHLRPAGVCHPGVFCDGCGAPVRGHRFKCIYCNDFDLCATCEARGVHDFHTMIRVSQPTHMLGLPHHIYAQLFGAHPHPHQHPHFFPRHPRHGSFAACAAAGTDGPAVCGLAMSGAAAENVTAAADGKEQQGESQHWQQHAAHQHHHQHGGHHRGGRGGNRRHCRYQDLAATVGDQANAAVVAEAASGATNPATTTTVTTNTTSTAPTAVPKFTPPRAISGAEVPSSSSAPTNAASTTTTTTTTTTAAAARPKSVNTHIPVTPTVFTVRVPNYTAPPRPASAASTTSSTTTSTTTTTAASSVAPAPVVSSLPPAVLPIPPVAAAAAPVSAPALAPVSATASPHSSVRVPAPFPPSTRWPAHVEQIRQMGIMADTAMLDLLLDRFHGALPDVLSELFQ